MREGLRSGKKVSKSNDGDSFGHTAICSSEVKGQRGECELKNEECRQNSDVGGNGGGNGDKVGNQLGKCTRERKQKCLQLPKEVVDAKSEVVDTKSESDESEEASLNCKHEDDVVADVGVSVNGDVDTLNCKHDDDVADVEVSVNGDVDPEAPLNCKHDDDADVDVSVNGDVEAKHHDDDDVVADVEVSVNIDVDAEAPLNCKHDDDVVVDVDVSVNGDVEAKHDDAVVADVDVSVNGDVEAEAPLNYQNDDDVKFSVNGNVVATVETSKNTNTVGKGRRGRKRKNVGSPKNGDDEFGEGVKKEGGPSLDSNCIGPSRDSEVSALERYGKEEKCEPEGMECLKDVDANGRVDMDEGKQKPSKGCRGRKRKNVESFDRNSRVDANGRVDMDEGKQKLSKGRRGRKRKNVESFDCNKDDRDGRKKVRVGAVQVSGRALRSRSGDVVEILDTEKDERSHPIGTPKKLKGRRGRPPKVQGRNGTVAVIKEDIIIRSKSPKMQKKQSTSEVIANEKQKVTGFMKNNDQPRVKLTIQDSEFAVDGRQNKLNSASQIEKQNDTGKPIKTPKENKTGEMGRREEKQLLREQIISILINAGWTIDHRPRQGKDYHDAVYVDCEGRTYWSVTLAYRKLKEKVENGNADSKAVSAFITIPEEILSKLFRVTTKGKKLKGGGKSGSKTGKTIAGKLSSKKKYDTKSISISKHKGKLSSALKTGKKSLKKRKKGDASDRKQDDSAGYYSRGMPQSNQEIRKGRKPCALLARSAAKGSHPDSDGFRSYNGKRSLWSWMIDLGTAPCGAKVKYMDSRTKVLVEGKITREGILCGCCNNIVPVLEFISHTGTSVSHDSHPLNDIHLGSGVSLLQCLVNSWSKQEESDPIKFCFVDIGGEDPNDDTCNICADGGDLICCDGCPSTFHQSCLDIEKFPSGEWRCIYCFCKFCKTIDGNVSQMDDNHRTPSDLLTCRLCEEKFHQLCIPGEDAMKVNPNCSSFCGTSCQKLFEQLNVLLGVKHQMEDGFSWTLLQHSDVSQDMSLSGAPLKLECNAKLAVAFSIMDECFCPIVDQRSGINMIHNVVYSCGSNFSRLNFGGFFTIILERGDDMISAASIRIHGNLLAEMPFIGTRHIYRRQGMCRRLLNAIELALCSLDVEKLVIPAISELHQTWTSVFGFKPLEESKRQEMKHMSVIVFPGTDMLQKPILKEQIANCNLISAAVGKSSAFSMEHQDVHGTPDNSDMSGCHTSASCKVIVQHARGINEEACAVKSILHPPDNLIDIFRKSGSVILRESADKESCISHLSLNHDGNNTISAGSICDALELNGQQTPEKMTECPNVTSVVTTVLTDKTSVESAFPQINSDVSNFEEKLIYATEEGKDATEFEQTKEVKYFKHNCISVAEDSFHSSDENLQHSLDVNVVHGCQVSGSCTMSFDAECGTQMQNSLGGLFNDTCSSPRKIQDFAHDLDASFAGNNIPNFSSERDDLTTCEPKVIALCDMKQLPCSADAVPSSTTGPSSDASCMNNGFRKSSDLQPGVDSGDNRAGGNSSSFTCPIGATCDTSSEAMHHLKEDFVVTESNHVSFNANTITNELQFCSKPFEQSKSGSEVDLSILTPDDSVRLCNSNSCPDVNRLCTSSSCSTPGVTEDLVVSGCTEMHMISIAGKDDIHYSRVSIPTWGMNA